MLVSLRVCVFVAIPLFCPDLVVTGSRRTGYPQCTFRNAPSHVEPSGPPLLSSETNSPKKAFLKPTRGNGPREMVLGADNLPVGQLLSEVRGNSLLGRPILTLVNCEDERESRRGRYS